METTRVDFHLHSTYSDGLLSPPDLVDRLAAEEVGFAALTDHDSVEGLDAFAEAAERRGIAVISGVEITAGHGEYEVHVLGYGFDAGDAELRAALRSIRNSRPPDVQSLEGSVRGRSSGLHPNGTGTHSAPVAHDGRISAQEAVRIVHAAGGRAFLAHPLHTEPDFERLRTLLTDLREMGLDGLEAVRGQQDQGDGQRLIGLASELGLLVSAGTDAHGRQTRTDDRVGVEISTELWKRFRDAVSSHRDGGLQCAPPRAIAAPRVHMRRRHFFFHVVFPTLLAIGLFAVAMFGVVVPRFEASLLDRKRETIRELTQSAWSILDGYERDVRAGRLTRAEAQQRAVEQIGRLRYGPENKDYFWIQDFHPRMIMHPYRMDLNGHDVSRFTDPRGVAIFVEFAKLVRSQESGYIDYVWQWKDDPTHLAPKESYIKGFEPWDWIIGTGIYTDDVRAETERLERRLLLTLAAIAVTVALLLLYVVRQGMDLERRRRNAESSLRDTTERYRSLVEATTEGTLLVIDGRCRYANPVFLEILGAGHHELELLDIEDIIPRSEGNDDAWQQIDALSAGEIEATGGFDGLLRRRDGRLIECVFALNRLSFGGRDGMILLATPLGVTPTAASGERLHPRMPDGFSDGLAAGIFRARATATGTVVAATDAAQRLLGIATGESDPPFTLASVFADHGAYHDLLDELRSSGNAERRLTVSTDAPEIRIVSLRATLLSGQDGAPDLIDGIIEDVTDEARRAAEQDALLSRLQASMLFLHEPLAKSGHRPFFCPMDMTVEQVAGLMKREQTTAVLVQAASGEVIGIFTDRDLRERVVAGEAALDTPVYRVMTSPLVTVPEQAEVYEALLAMEANQIQHIAVADHTGSIVGVIEDHELLTFRDYGPIVLMRQIDQAEEPAEVSEAARRAPGMGRTLLESGAHPHRVTRMLTSVCDAATQRLVELAISELGSPPGRFAFVALGSQGRGEMAFSSDQDNAIIYDDAAGADAQEYFLELGARTCDRLADAGYPLCKGEAMARNPKWCRPLSTWRGYFTNWVREAEPEQLLEFTVFFDFRAVYGDSHLTEALRTDVYDEVRRYPAFLTHIAQNAMMFRPPLRLFGRVLMGATGSDGAAALNVKDAISPIQSFARLYALRHGIDHTHSLDRLDALAEAGVLTNSSRNDTKAAYDLLTRLRLAHQAAGIESGNALDNMVEYATLTPADASLLNQTFAQITAIQKRISHDFLGGVET